MTHNDHTQHYLGLASLYGLHAIDAATQGHCLVAGISLMAGLIYWLMAAPR